MTTPRRGRRRTGLASALALLLVLVAWAEPVAAHKSSDAYLAWSRDDDRRVLRVDVALRDLDQIVMLDANDDGAVTWGELRAARDAIVAEMTRGLRLEDGRCPLRLREQSVVARGDGRYASMTFEVDCAVARPRLSYGLFDGVDPTHRGLLRQATGPAALAPGATLRLEALPAAAGRAEEAGTPAPAAAGPDADTARAGSARSDAVTARDERGPVESGGARDAERPVSPGEARADVQPADADAAAPGPASFVTEGVHHIFTGYDHLLFLLALLLPAGWLKGRSGWMPGKGLRATLIEVAGLVTTFTLAHSLTLALAALDILRPPSAPVELAIAATIALAAIDNLWPWVAGSRRWAAFAFGLIHGFAFASVLAEAEVPASQLAWTLLAFNVGVEIGQLGFVALALCLLIPLRRWRGYERWVMRGGSWAALGAAGAWAVERTAVLVRG